MITSIRRSAVRAWGNCERVGITAARRIGSPIAIDVQALPEQALDVESSVGAASLVVLIKREPNRPKPPPKPPEIELPEARLISG